MIDNDISPHIGPAINALVEPRGHLVVALRQKFKSHPTDIEWISALGAEGGWAVISNNIDITKVAIERQAWRQTDLVGYFFARGWRKLDPLEQAARLLLWWPKLEAHGALTRGGSAFELPINAGSKLRSLPI
jgi:hypothetical protein